MNKIHDSAKKAYEFYDKLSKTKQSDVTTSQLNVIYNVLCRIKRDDAFAKEVDALKKDGDAPLCVLIEKYFEDYNNLYGLDIRETLTEYENMDLNEGAYFVIKTFKKEQDGTLACCSPLEYSAGETAYVNAVLYSHLNNMPTVVDKLRLVWVSEDGNSCTTIAENSSEMNFELSLSVAGQIKFKIVADDSLGKIIPGVEIAYGGVVFSKDKIRPTSNAPKDLVEFWSGEIERAVNTDPTSKSADQYAGGVEYLYDMPSKNRYNLIYLDGEYLGRMRDNLQPTVDDSTLERYDIWDVSLKSPGPCPATAYISLPKFAQKHSLPIKFVFDGYGVRCPAPIVSETHIIVHASHHGYELGMADKTYYEPLRTGICAEYGRASGKINSDYDDIHDCYMTYLNLRNFQMLRFCTNPDLSSALPLLHEKWNGEVILSGGSMGGYQAICLGAIAAIFKKIHRVHNFRILSIDAAIPAFCNLSGYTEGRIKTTLTNYAEGCEYFDAAIMAQLVDAPVKIPRVALGDEICPVSGIIAMFNSIPKRVKKEINFLQNSSHGYLPAAEFQDWFRYEN